MSVMTPEEIMDRTGTGSNANNRWSYHLANDPFGGGAASAWAKQFYDNPNIDPGAEIQQRVGAFRSQYGSLAPADDASVINMIASGQTPQQSPSQAWNSSSSVSTSGPSNDEFLQFLISRAKQGTAIGRDDPNVRAQVDPFVAQTERASRNYLDDVAERAGGRPVNMTGERRMAAERAGQAAGSFEGEVIGREVGARRDEISQALSLWGDQLSNSQRLALEKELAYLNDRARTADRGQNMDQFLRELQLRGDMFDDDSAYRWASLGG